MTSVFPRYARGPVELGAIALSERRAPRVLLVRAARAKSKMRRRINRALDAGDIQKAKGLQKLYVKSFSAKLSAVAKVNPVLKSAQCARSSELVAVASRLRPFQPSSEAVKVIAKPKLSGGWRPLTVFGLERAAMQAVAREAMSHFHTPDPRQFAISGGGHNEAARFIKQSISEGYGWFVGLDISSFFSSIERRSLKNILPLPTNMVEHVICPPPAGAIRIERVGRAFTGQRLAEASQSGISQGSRSSPLVAEIIVKRILAQFALDVRIINDADDFGIMARTKRDADAISKALIRASARSPAGCFQLRSKAHSGARRACDGFDFLGYRFRKRPSTIICEPTDLNWIKFNTRVRDLAILIEQGAPTAIHRLRRYVLNWWRAFPLVDVHLRERDFYWARYHVEQLVKRQVPTALPLVSIAMEWDRTSYAPLPNTSVLTDLARAIRRRHPRHTSDVSHWH